MAPRGFVVMVALVALSLSVLCTDVLAGRDYYEVLGVTRDASTAEIKRAFRKLSLKVCVQGAAMTR